MQVKGTSTGSTHWNNILPPEDKTWANSRWIHDIFASLKDGSWIFPFYASFPHNTQNKCRTNSITWNTFLCDEYLTEYKEQWVLGRTNRPVTESLPSNGLLHDASDCIILAFRRNDTSYTCSYGILIAVSSGSTIPGFRNLGDTQTHRQQGDLISLLLFFQSKESRLKINCNLMFKR
jgi:hypothetical protein